MCSVILFYTWLNFFSGVDNVCGILTCVRNKGNVAFILPFIRHDRFQVNIFHADFIR